MTKNTPVKGDRFARLLAIVAVLKTWGSASSEELCALFSITEKELWADVALLVNTEFYQERHDKYLVFQEQNFDAGIIQLSKDLGLGRQIQLSPLEIELLKGALNGIENIARDVFGKEEREAYQNVRDQLQVIYPQFQAQQISLDLNPRSEKEHLEVINEALEKGVELYITYPNAKHELQSRLIAPWRITSNPSSYYLQAYCHQAGDNRVFRLDRIVEVRITANKAKPPVEAPDLPELEFLSAGEEVQITFQKPALGIIEATPGAQTVAESAQTVSARIPVVSYLWFKGFLHEHQGKILELSRISHQEELKQELQEAQRNYDHFVTEESEPQE